MNDKKAQRQLAYQQRHAQLNKPSLSQFICEKFMDQQEYQQAETVMWYLHCRSEVQTLEAVNLALQTAKKIVIPYCTKDIRGQPKLGLWWLEDLAELVAGTWGILEPPKSRWGEQGKEVVIDDLDLIMVPTVACDCQGGRLGNGAGYYDRLLQQIKPHTFLTAVCYQSQIFDHIVMESHDVLMHRIITEQNNYDCCS